MEAMRESWTDDRMDDLNGKVDALRLETRTEFKAVRGELKDEFHAVRTEMKEEFAAVRGEMKAGFDKIDDRFERMEIRGDQRFEAMMDRLCSLQRMMFQFCGGGLVALIGFIATQV
jgi:hypothetical protein